jgi:aryl-alcohol dehydrogenase-like predicted oxidoreductase
METRPFGKTGERFSILSFGAQRMVEGHGCSEAEAIRMVHYALDHGIRYFDTAWVYSEGQSEERVGKVARHRRAEMWIATKVRARASDAAMAQLEESLKRLQTDHVDEWRMHNIATMDELETILAPGGAVEAAMRAREQGKVRYISMSGHRNPQVQVEALRRFPFDSMLVALSALDHFMMSYAEEFLPVAHAQGIAVVAMKVLALAKLGPYYERSLRYSMGLPVSTAIVGMESMEQLQKNLAVAERFTPLTDEEKLEFYKEIIHLATPEVMRWKTQDYFNPTEWEKRAPRTGIA